MPAREDPSKPHKRKLLLTCKPRPEKYKLKVRMPKAEGARSFWATLEIPAGKSSLVFSWDDSEHKLDTAMLAALAKRHEERKLALPAAAAPIPRADAPAVAPGCESSSAPVHTPPPSEGESREPAPGVTAPVTCQMCATHPTTVSACGVAVLAPPEPAATPSTSRASESVVASDAPAPAVGTTTDAPIDIDDLPDEDDPGYAAAIGAPAASAAVVGAPAAHAAAAPAARAAARKPKRVKKRPPAPDVPRPSAADDVGLLELADGREDAQAGSCRPPDAAGMSPCPPSPRAAATLILQQSKVVASVTEELEQLVDFAEPDMFGTPGDNIKPDIERVLKQGARVWGLRRLTESAMHRAARRNSPELVRLLFEQGIDCHPPPVASAQFGDPSGNNPLSILAWQTGDHPIGDSFPFRYDKEVVLEIGRIMVAHSADPVQEVNWPERHGWTPIMTAAEHSATELLQVMLPHANLAVADKRGFTALHWAARSVRPAAGDTVQLLLDNGADRHAKSNRGETPADMARAALTIAKGKCDTEAQAVLCRVLQLLKGAAPKRVGAASKPVPSAFAMTVSSKRQTVGGGGAAAAAKPALKRPHTGAAGCTKLARRAAPAGGSATDSRRSRGSPDPACGEHLGGRADRQLVAVTPAAEWHARLIRVAKKDPNLHSIALHLSDSPAPGLQTLAQEGLLRGQSMLLLLASPPKKLSIKGCLFREPLSVLLRHILPDGPAADPSVRRLLRHCGEVSCDAEAAKAVFSPDADAGPPRVRQEARLDFLRWLDVCACSALARALVRVKTLREGTEYEMQDGALERGHLLYHLSGPAPIAAGAPGAAAASAATPVAAVWAANEAAPLVKRKLDEAAWPTRIRQLLALWWARAVGPGWDSAAQMRLASSVFESRPFGQQLLTILTCTDPKVSLNAQLADDDRLPPFVYTAEYLSYNAFPTLPSPPAAGCKCVRGEDGVPCCRVGNVRWDCSCSSRSGQACGFVCGCAAAPSDCVNRRWTHGAAKELRLTYAQNHEGWGVVAGEFIKKDEYVCEYIGECITESEDNRRADLLRVSGDYTFKSLSTIGVGAGKHGVYIDAFSVRNVAAFINFRCDPNLYAKPIRATGDDPRWFRVGLFAKTDIKLLEELGYLRDPGATTKAKFSEMECKCGAGLRGGACRGRL